MKIIQKHVLTILDISFYYNNIRNSGFKILSIKSVSFNVIMIYF